MSAKVQAFTASIVFFLIPLLVLAWTSMSTISGYTLHLFMLFLLISIGMGFVKKKEIKMLKNIFHVATAMLLVGSTGWFFSPFFFLLYLLAVYLGFLYRPHVSFSFLAALLVIFSTSVGEIDIAYDIMTLLSLLLVIPIVIYLRKRYLVVRQTNKDILILEDGGGIKNMDTITRLLANKITSMGVIIRQPLSFIKQASSILIEDDINPKEATKLLSRIRTSANEALEQIRSFEGKTSKNEVIRTKKKGL